ncbi:hypothetical protein N665_0120s0040, partial [Sinapis alba]
WTLNMEDIDRFSRTLPNCIVRKFNDNGPFLLLKTVRLYVGYHMIMGFELPPMIAQLMKERNIHLRGLTHPIIFMNKLIVHDILDPQIFDKYKIMGGVPVSHANIYKLLRLKSHVLLYPGGVREALHRKALHVEGEEYKLFWPEKPEFVRVASEFGATINVPFGVVGEDDICKIVLDSNDQRNIPFLKDLMERATKEAGKATRTNWETKISIYQGSYLRFQGDPIINFGKPIETSGKEQELGDKEKAQKLYLQVKSQVEQCIAYLKMKRECDPYRNLLPRMLYQASHGFSSEIPTFDLWNDHFFDHLHNLYFI